jgi:peroxiredoxin
MNELRSSLRFPAGLVLVFLVTVLFACAGSNRESKLSKGDPAPAFQTHDLNGQPVSMAAFQGNPVILRFWSVDCRYCRADTPIFNQYFERYKDKGLKVIYINTLSAVDEVHSFVADLAIRFPVVLDTDGAIAASYRVKLVPQTIIISPAGRIVAAQLGGVGEEELKTLLAPFLPDIQ